MLCAYVDEIEKVTPAQMDAQARDFDNWAICDTLCFALWVRSPHAFKKIRQWSSHKAEYVKRASFALLASMALKHKTSTDADYLRCLPLIAKAASDERNFVKKAVNWALRGIGRRSRKLNKASIALAKKLAESEDAAPRWIGKDALRELSSAAVQKRLASVNRAPRLLGNGALTPSTASCVKYTTRSVSSNPSARCARWLDSLSSSASDASSRQPRAFAQSPMAA